MKSLLGRPFSAGRIRLQTRVGSKTEGADEDKDHARKIQGSPKTCRFNQVGFFGSAANLNIERRSPPQSWARRGLMLETTKNGAGNVRDDWKDMFTNESGASWQPLCGYVNPPK